MAKFTIEIIDLPDGVIEVRSFCDTLPFVNSAACAISLDVMDYIKRSASKSHHFESDECMLDDELANIFKKAQEE